MDLTKLRKMESPGARRAALGATGIVTAIVKVKRAGYRPPHLKVRSEISDNLFTAEFPAEALPALESDPGIVTVSLSRPLQTQSA